MVNVSNLRKRNSTGSTLPSAGERNNFLKIVEEIANKRSLTIPAEFTRREIPKFFADSENDGLKMDSFRLSLIDPISMLRIRIPVRSVECDHFQCFDLHNFLEFSLKNMSDGNNKNAWRCPNCQAEAKQEKLRVDGYFQEILHKVGPEPLQVELLPDGEWREVEQMEFKELDSIDDEEIVEIVPKKKTKISDEKTDKNAPESSDSSQMPFDKEFVRADDLREILGTAPGEDLLEAIRKLKQKADALEKRALDCSTPIPPIPISGKTSEEQEAKLREENKNKLKRLEARNSKQEELLKRNALEKIKRFWVKFSWEGEMPPGWESPFRRGQPFSGTEFRQFLRKKAGVDPFVYMSFGRKHARVALRSREDADRIVKKLNGHVYFGFKLQLEFDSADEIVVPMEQKRNPVPNNNNHNGGGGGGGGNGEGHRQNTRLFYPPQQRQPNLFLPPLPPLAVLPPTTTTPWGVVHHPIGGGFQQFPAPLPGVSYCQSFTWDGFHYR